MSAPIGRLKNPRDRCAAIWYPAGGAARGMPTRDGGRVVPDASNAPRRARDYRLAEFCNSSRWAGIKFLASAAPAGQPGPMKLLIDLPDLDSRADVDAAVRALTTVQAALGLIEGEPRFTIFLVTELETPAENLDRCAAMQ